MYYRMQDGDEPQFVEAEVTKEQRAVGKTLNFGIVYGQTAYGLADELGVPLQRAEALLAVSADGERDRNTWEGRTCGSA
jgi:hypothetical protein